MPKLSKRRSSQLESLLIATKSRRSKTGIVLRNRIVPKKLKNEKKRKRRTLTSSPLIPSTSKSTKQDMAKAHMALKLKRINRARSRKARKNAIWARSFKRNLEEVKNVVTLQVILHFFTIFVFRNPYFRLKRCWQLSAGQNYQMKGLDS